MAGTPTGTEDVTAPGSLGLQASQQEEDMPCLIPPETPTQYLVRAWFYSRVNLSFCKW